MVGRARPLVLVCDDEAGPRLAMTCMLAGSCEMVVTTAGDAALAACDSHQFDVAIVDWTVPAAKQSGSGLETVDGAVVHALRRADPDLAILVWSAHGSRIEEAARCAGAHALITKPISPDAAESCVHEAASVTRQKRAISAAKSAG